MSLLPRRAMRALSLVAVGAASVLSLSACSSNLPSKTPPPGTAKSSTAQTINMWIAGNSVTQPIYTAEAKAYSAKHPGVNVVLTDLPGPQYLQKYDAAAAAGKLPEIFQMPGAPRTLQTLAGSDKIANLSSMFSAGSALTSRLLPVSLPPGQLDGKQYGVPYNIFQEAVVLYSKPAFKKAGISHPPQNWDQLLHDVTLLKKAGIIPISISGTVADNWYGWWLETYEERLDGLGVYNALKKGDMSALDSKPVIQAAQAMQDLVKLDPFEPGYTTTSENNNIPYALLGSNKAGMLLYGAFTPNFIAQSAPSFVKSGQMGWFSYPTVAHGSGDGIVNLGTPPLLLVNNTVSAAKKKAAEDFLASFVYSPEQVTSLAKTGNVGPASKAASAVEAHAPAYLKSYMHFQLQESADAKGAATLWSTYIPADALTQWNTLKAQLFSLKITPQQFAAEAAALK